MFSVILTKLTVFPQISREDAEVCAVAPESEVSAHWELEARQGPQKMGNRLQKQPHQHTRLFSQIIKLRAENTVQSQKSIFSLLTRKWSNIPVRFRSRSWSLWWLFSALLFLFATRGTFRSWRLFAVNSIFSRWVMVSVGGSSTFIGIVDHKVLIRLLAITVLIVVSLQLFVVRRAGPLPLLSLPGTEGTSLERSQLNYYHDWGLLLPCISPVLVLKINI